MHCGVDDDHRNTSLTNNKTLTYNIIEGDACERAWQRCRQCCRSNVTDWVAFEVQLSNASVLHPRIGSQAAEGFAALHSVTLRTSVAVGAPQDDVHDGGGRGAGKVCSEQPG